MSIAVRPQPIEGLRAVVCLGLAPLVGLAVQFDLAFAFGAVAFAVLLLTTAVVYMVRDLADDSHVDLYAILIAAFWVSIAQLVMNFVAPDIERRMGIYLPSLAASPLILSRVPGLISETENSGKQFREAFSFGIGFWALISVSGLVREIFSAGTLTVPFMEGPTAPIVIPVLSDNPIALIASGAGGLILLGFLLAFKTAIEQRRAIKTILRESPPSKAGETESVKTEGRR